MDLTACRRKLPASGADTVRFLRRHVYDKAFSQHSSHGAHVGTRPSWQLNLCGDGSCTWALTCQRRKHRNRIGAAFSSRSLSLVSSIEVSFAPGTIVLHAPAPPTYDCAHGPCATSRSGHDATSPECQKDLSINDSVNAPNRISSSVASLRELFDGTAEPQRHHCRNCLRAGLRFWFHASVQRVQHLRAGSARALRRPRIQSHDLRDLERAARRPLTDPLAMVFTDKSNCDPGSGKRPEPCALFSTARSA